MTVRLGVARDETSLLALLEGMHSEVGLFPYDSELVRDLVHPVLSPNGQLPPVPTIIGVIGPIGDVHASLCVQATRVYYSQDWHLGDLWCYVRPAWRKSSYLKDLLVWGKGVGRQMGLKYISGVVTIDRTEAKMRRWRREFGEAIGGYFMAD